LALPTLWALGAPVCAAALTMHHHDDDVYVTSQLCHGLRGMAAKILEKKLNFLKWTTPEQHLT